MSDPWQIAWKNKGLAGAEAERFVGLGLDRDDLFQEGLIGLRQAAIEYDPGRGASFATYARLHLLRSMTTAVRRCGRWARCVVDPDPDPPAAPAMDGDERERILAAIARLTPRERFVITGRYGLDGEPPRLVREIAAELGMDASTVFRAERAAMARLAAMLGEGG